MADPITHDALLNGRITLHQWRDSYRVSSESVLCAGMVAGEFNTIADFGAGVGALSLLCAQHGYKNITAIEKHPQYCQLLNQNIIENNMTGAITPLCADIFTHNGQYDMIITNPPYFNNSSPSPKPLKRVAQVMDGWTISDWFMAILRQLQPNGVCYFVVEYAQLPALRGVFGAGHCQIIPLNVGVGKPIKRCIGKYSHNKAPSFVVLDEFCLHLPDGRFTDGANDILRNAHSINLWE